MSGHRNPNSSLSFAPPSQPDQAHMKRSKHQPVVIERNPAHRSAAETDRGLREEDAVTCPLAQGGKGRCSRSDLVQQAGFTNRRMNWAPDIDDRP